jgi:hypothetical protein
VEGPAGASEADIIQAVRRQYLMTPAAAQPAEDKQGFMAGIRSGIENLKGDVGALGAGLGIEGGEAYARAQAAKAAELYQQPKFSEAPVDYVTGMLGQSLPYIAAPLAAAAGTAALPLTGVAATAAGLGAAGLASATQFTGSNLSRQLDEGRTTDTLELGNAALAAIPQAALDTLSLKLLPGIGRIFGTAGKELTEDAAQAAARAVLARGTGNLVKQYGGAVLKTAGIEGLTETGQQVLERAQAELEMLDPEARGEYLDSFIGGALLGGTLAAPGKAFERGADRRKLAEADKRKAAEQAAEAARTQAEYEKTDDYALDVAAKYETARTQLAELEGQKRKAKKGTPTFDEDTAHNKAIIEQQKALREETNFKDLAEKYKALGPRAEQAKRMTTMTPEDALAEDIGLPGVPTRDARVGGPRRRAVMSGAELPEGVDAEAFPSAPLSPEERTPFYVEQQLRAATQRAKQAAIDANPELGMAGIDASEGVTLTGDQMIEALLEDPGQAMAVVQTRGALPGMSASQANLIRAGLRSRFAESAKADAERTKRTMEERQDLLQQQRMLPDEEPDLFAEQQLETAEDRLLQQYNYDQNLGFVPSLLERASAQAEPDVAAPEGAEFSERAQSFLQRLDALDQQINQAKTEQERATLRAQQAQISSTSDADPSVRAVNEVRTNANDALMTLEELSDMLREGRFLGSGRYETNKQERADLEQLRNDLDDQLAAEREQFAKLTEPQSLEEDGVRREQPETQRAAKDAIAAQRTRIGQLEQEIARIQQQLDVPESGVTTRQALSRRAEEAKQAYITAVLQEAAALRRIRGEKGVTLDEALKAADQINTELDELLNRSQAVREVEEVITQPAQMRGTELVSSAKTERRDVRPLEQRPFAKYRAALGTILEGVDNTRRALTAPRKVQARAEKSVLKTQFAETEAKRVAEERGETATTLSGELRRRAEFVRNKMGRMKGGMRPAARDLLNKAADVLDEGKPTRDILDATETVVDSILRGQMPLERDLRALKDALAATQETPAGQKDLFDTTTDRRRKDQEVGVIRKTPEAFNKVPAVVQARAAADKAREEAKKIEGVLNSKRAAARALQAIRSRIADLENKISSTLERTKPAARSANSFFSFSPTFVDRMDASKLAKATPERRAEYAAALKVEAQYQAMRQEFDDKFKREGAASRAAVAPLQETKAVLDKQEKAFAKRISDLEQLLQDPALVAASKARAEAKDILAVKESELQAQVAEQRADLQAAMDRAIAELRPAFDAVALATNPSVVNATKALDAAEAALDKTREQINNAGDIGASLKFDFVYDKQRKDTEQAKAVLEDVVAKAQAEYDKKALIVQAYQDGMVKVELDALNRLEKRLAKVRTELGMASPEARSVQQEVAAQQKALDLAEAQRREERELAAKQQRQYDDRMAKGFGLPFARRVAGKVEGYQTPEKETVEEAKERFERYAADVARIEKGEKAQTPKRARGPVARTQSAAPAAMRTGTTESREGAARTQTDMRTTEARGEAERNVVVSSSEMQEANRLSEEMQEANRAAEALRKMTPKERRAQAREAQKEAREIERMQRETDKAFSKARDEGILDDDIFEGPVVDVPDTLPEKALVRMPGFKTLLTRDAKGDQIAVQQTREEALEATRAQATRAKPAAKKTVEDALTFLRDVAGQPFDNTDAMNGKTMVEVARMFEKRSQTAWRKQVFAAVADALEALPVTEVQGRVFVTAAKMKNRGGFYLPEDGVVVLGPNSKAEIVLHELIHAASSDALRADSTFFKRVDALREKAADWFETKEGKAFHRKYGTFLLSKDASLRAYGLKNPHEFLAEAMSNRYFQMALASIPTDKPVAKNLFKNFVDILAQFFGLDKAGQKTVLAEAVALTGEIFDFTKAHINKYEALPKARASAKRTEVLEGIVADIRNGKFPGTAPIGNSDMPADVSSVVNKVVAEPKSLAGKIMANVAGLSFRTQFIDRFAPIEELLRKGVERKLIPAMQSFQTQYFLRFGEQRSQFLQQSASDGVVQLVRAKDGSFTIEGKSGANLANIAKTLNGSGLGNEQNVEGLFTTYLAGIRAKQDGIGVEKLNFENKVTQKDLDAVNRYIDANPKAKAAFEKARDEYREYNKNLLKLLADSGAITREEAARLGSKEYVPYYREDANGVVNLIVGSEKSVRIGNIVDQPYLKELVGGNDKILPFFAGAMQNTSMLLDMALRNLQTKDVAHTLRKMGAAKIGEGVGPSDRNKVYFKEHGKAMFAIIDSDDFGVPADLLIQGMQGIKTAMPFAIKALGYPADVLRKFVTRNPAYAVRQAIRDPLNAWLTTGGNFVPVLSSFKELGSMVAGRSPNERILQQAGAISSNVFNGGGADIEMILRDISAGKGGYDRLMSKADAFAMQGDAATRAVLYNKYREQGMTHMQALLGALESMNFARRGISPSMQYLSTMIPFFNAQVQGLDVIYRAMAGKTTFEKEMDVRSKLFKRGLMMAAATMAYAALMEDDEAYKNATPEERAQNWFVYLPGMDEPIRLPIPFELGMVFKAVPELIWNTAFSDQELSGAAKTIGKLAYNTVPLGLPQGIKPALEVAMNYSLYSGDNIVSQREQGLATSEQFRTNTSELAKMLGSVGVLSPIQIEYLIRGYTGGLGVVMTQLPNPALRPLNSEDMPDGPAKKVSQMPIIGNLFQPTDGRGIINAAYEQADEFQKASNTYKKMLEQGRRADAQAYAQRYSAEIAANSLGGAFRQQMGELAKVRRLIESSKDLTPEQKRVRIDGLRQIELKLAQRVREYGKTTPQ